MHFKGKSREHIYCIKVKEVPRYYNSGEIIFTSPAPFSVL